MANLRPRADGRAWTGGNIQFDEDWIKKLPGMDGKFDSPKGPTIDMNKIWKKVVKLPEKKKD